MLGPVGPLKGFVGVGVRARVVAAMVGGQSSERNGMDARLQNRVRKARGLMGSVRASWWSVERRGGADLCVDAAGDERAWDAGYQASRGRRVVERVRTAAGAAWEARSNWRRARTEAVCGGGVEQRHSGQAERQANGRGRWSTACQRVGWRRVVRRSVVKQGRAGQGGVGRECRGRARSTSTGWWCG